MNISSDFDIETILRCFGDDEFQLESKAIRYYIAKELEEEYFKDNFVIGEQGFKLLKHIPCEIYGDYVIAGDIQKISCKLIS